MAALAVLTSDLSPVRADHDPRLRAMITAALPALGRFVTDLRAVGSLVVHLRTTPTLIPAQAGPLPPPPTPLRPLAAADVGPGPAQVPADLGRAGDLLLAGLSPRRCAAGVSALLRERGVDLVVLLAAERRGSARAVAVALADGGAHVLAPREGLIAASRAEQVRALRGLAASCATVMSMARVRAGARAWSRAGGL